MSNQRQNEAPTPQDAPAVQVDVTGVGVLDRVAAILDAVETNPMRATELARHLGITVPTAHRLARAMVVHDFLRRDAEGRHHPGQRFLSNALARTAEPILDELSVESSESCQLWVRRGHHRLCLTSVEAKHELRAYLPASMMLPIADGGSAAEALCATEPTPEWFEGIGARIPGLCSVSAPVWLDGEVTAAVCLAAPTSRAPRGPGRHFGSAVAAAARRIEEALQLMT